MLRRLIQVSKPIKAQKTACTCYLLQQQRDISNGRRTISGTSIATVASSTSANTARVTTKPEVLIQMPSAVHQQQQQQVLAVKEPLYLDRNVTSPYFYIYQASGEWNSCIATQNLQVGQIIGAATGIFYSVPTRFTIQADTNRHIEFGAGLQFVNHSCNPNCRFIVSESSPEVALVAIKNISKGDHLSFDYATTEWDMEEKFDCKCGASNCRGHVGGAKYLTDLQVLRNLSYFSPSVMRALLQRRMAVKK